jgi:hypothetical protein
MTSRAALTPEAEIAVVSKGILRTGILSDEKGKGPEIVPAQEGGMTMIVLGPNPLRTYLRASTAPQPGHAVCPEQRSSSSGMGNFT